MGSVHLARLLTFTRRRFAAGVVHWLLNVIDERLHAAVGETHEQLDFLLGRGALDFEGQGFASWHGNHRAYLQTVLTRS